MEEDEEITYNFCTELLEQGTVSDPTYARALAKLGEAGVVELASLEGYHTYLSMIMTAAKTGAQPGSKPRLFPFPR